MANLERWQVDVLQVVNSNVPFIVEAGRVSGQWRGFAPEIILSDLRLSFVSSGENTLELSEGRVTVDVLNSVLSGSVQLTHVVFVDLNLHGELDSDGRFSLRGLGEGEGASTAFLREFLLNVENMTLRNNVLHLRTPAGGSRRLGLDLRLSRDGSQRHMEARLTSARGTVISLLADGVGDPTRPESFVGESYVAIQATDLAAAREFISAQPLPAWAEGALELQLWLGWDAGVPSMELQLEGRDWLISSANDSWELPLERLALQASLARSDARWSVTVSDLALEQDEVSLALPALQLGIEGKTAQLLTRDVVLEDVAALMSASAALPAQFRDIAAALNPRGRLPVLEITLSDIEKPRDTWRARANFDDLEVDSYRGAPGSDAISGYVTLSPGEGLVTIDSQNPTLDFPSVFMQPLTFDALYGSLAIDWNTDRVRIDSGILTTQGEEGTARVLLGLEIPTSPLKAGIEMDLLVGLQDAHPTHRVKYTPYVLNAGLLQWLRDSIGDGVIEQGAFLWRGSLNKDAPQLRTVQLAFNVADMDLTYHSLWPPVTVQEGVILIDNTDVSVWAERAVLYDSVVEDLSVETWLGEQNAIMLALQGEVSGPAKDGLQVLNNSPLSGVAGSAFVNWQTEGQLHTRLDILLNLSDGSVPPVVEVVTQWRDVDIMIIPGNLAVDGVSGQFEYSTARGFASRDLQGFLWGQRIAAQFRQEHPDVTDRYDAALTVLNIDLATVVSMTDVRDWLQLDLLAFADGHTPAIASLRVTPGERPLLTLQSELQGVQLNLPPPWEKLPEQSRPLKLSLLLGAGTMPLSLSLGDDLALLLSIVEGRIDGGALGLETMLPDVEAGVLRVVGHTPLVDVDAWLEFVDTYITVPSQLSAERIELAAQAQTAGPQVPLQRTPTLPHAESSGGLPFEFVIDNVQADRAVFGGQSLQDVTVRLVLEDTLWHFAMDNSWLRAELTLPRSPAPYILDIDYLDLAGLPQVAPSGAGEAIGLQLPPMDITLGNLYHGEVRLGDLALDLHSEAGLMRAEGITGTVAGTRLPPEAPGQLLWQSGGGGYTSLSGHFGFGDLGDTLEQLGYQRIVETDEGAIELDLRWPGAPWEFSVATGEGAVLLDIQSGSFLDAPSGAQGALRVVSMLNLADIVSRLSLSHMFESGIPFDSVKGEIYLHRGTVEVPLVEVTGGSSFQFSGLSEIETRSLSGELVATLPVASNLPWIAALAASIPVAAGVYVVSKLFDQQMSRLSSAVYSIGGTWDDPQVNFDRIFDNTAVGGPETNPQLRPGLEPATRVLPAAILEPPADSNRVNSAPQPMP